jgi:hypothetical protein
MFKIIIFVYCFIFSQGFRLLQHPLEKRIAYIDGLTEKDIKNIDQTTLYHLQEMFKSHPLLIFKGIYNVSPTEFINFVKLFDKDRDNDSLENPQENKDQLLQPFTQFPDCNHVAPKGNIELNDFYGIKKLNIKPESANTYLWHTDILGHEYKLPNVVTGFYIIEQPLIGGHTDFISGETIYENLSNEEQMASHNILIEINRSKLFIDNKIKMDYAGVNRLEWFEHKETGNTRIPLVFAPDDINEKPRILLTPTYFEKVVGWSVQDSREWIQQFMLKNVLPYRTSIQWKKGDLAVLNNRRFMHSGNPARNYLDNKDSSKRLLLLTFIPTNRPLYGIKPSYRNVHACYNVKWCKDKKQSLLAAHENIKFVINTSRKNNEPVNDTDYILSEKLINSDE